MAFRCKNKSKNFSYILTALIHRQQSVFAVVPGKADNVSTLLLVHHLYLSVIKYKYYIKSKQDGNTKINHEFNQTLLCILAQETVFYAGALLALLFDINITY